MNIIKKLWDLAKEAETPEVSNAYMIALLYVEDYIREQKEKEKKEQIEIEEGVLALTNALVEFYESRTNNAD